MEDKRKMDGTKLLHHMDRVIQCYDKHMKVPPILINLGATKKCNANCIYCFGTFQGKDQKSFIEKEPLLNLFEDAPKLGVKSIEIIGDGEPTLNPYIYEAMDIGKKNGLDMAFSTNGILLDDNEKRENILRNCTWMRFNISCGKRNRYKVIHRVDKYDVVKKNIEEMVKLKHKKGYVCDIGLQAVFVPGLMNKDMIDLSKLALETRVDYLVIKQCSLPTDKQCNDVSFNINDYDKPEVIKALKRCESMSTKKTQIVVKWNFMEFGKKKSYNHCVDVPLLFQVSGNGKCYPCGFLFGNEKYCYGDLNEKRLGNILVSKRYNEIVDYMVNKFNVHKDCHGCCRHDASNKFINEYINNKPKGVNFI